MVDGYHSERVACGRLAVAAWFLLLWMLLESRRTSFLRLLFRISFLCPPRFRPRAYPWLTVILVDE
jgi:hypothetical protein